MTATTAKIDFPFGVKEGATISPATKRKERPSALIFTRALLFASLSLLTLLITTAGCGKDPAMRLFSEAEVQLSRGEYIEAITTHTRVLKKYPDTELAPQSLFKIAHIYYHYLDNIKMAMKTYDELAFLYPESATLMDAAMERGEIYSTLGKHWKAVEEYEWLLTNGAPKENNRYQYLIAMEYFKMNDFKQARIEFAEIKDTDNEAGLAPEILFRIATSYYLEKNLTKSLEAYKEVIRKFPKDKLAFQSSINIAQVYSDAGRLKEAKELLTKLKTDSDTKENDLIDIRIALIEERIKNPTRRTKRKK
ncbi:MAG: tetratricopeptide repeat protein [Proteobacteria bacterium]|nr:tetratricopeptide repeat protein [Pseudomonadota bacterium]